MTQNGSQQTTIWTDEKIALLRELIDDRLSAGLISEQLGCSRNAVIGKIHRLGLSLLGSTFTKPCGGSRKSGSSNAPHHQRAARIVKRKEQIGPTPILAPAEPEHGNKTIQELGYHDCRWPLGASMAPAELFCGARALFGRPYCAEHCCRGGMKYRGAPEQQMEDV